MKKLLLLFIFVLTFSSLSFAATFVVNNNGDTHDANTTDNLCLDSNGNCTLRAAIEQANALGTDDRILFNLPANSTITLGWVDISNSGTLEVIGTGADNLTIYGRILTEFATVTISGLTLTGGRVDAGSGGGIYAKGGSVTLDGVHVTGNITSMGQGGGAAFYGGSHRIINSTFSRNFASSCGGFSNAGGSTLTVENSTISDNRTTDGAAGGGFCNFDGNITLRNVTITNNIAETQGGGFFQSGGTLSFGNTIVAGNTAKNGGKPEIALYGGSITSVGGNLVGVSPGDSTDTANPITYQPTDIRDMNPMLGALQNNGGTTPTQALLVGSPAINVGNNAYAPSTTDQRGFPRIIGGTIDIGAFELQVVCDFSINPTSQPFDTAGGNTTVNVTSPSGCSWTAASNASWISVTNGNSGNGNGAVSLAIQPNTGIARTGTVTIAGQTFTVTQASGCAYTLSPTSTNISASGGTGSFNINSGTGCPWTAASNVPWITVTSGNNGTASGTVSFSVSANTGIARTGTITAGGQTFTVNQANGCAYSLSQTSATVAATGGSFTVNVSAGEGCAWSALSNVPWIVGFTSGNTIGNGTVTFSVQANTGPARTGTITIAGQTFTVTQSTGCTYSLSSNGTAFTAAGGSGSFNVAANNGCVWTAVSDSPWLTINSGSSGNGNGAVSFSVQANVGPERTGTITVNGQTFTVTQANGCSFSISATSLSVGKSAGTGSFNINSGAECVWTASSNASWITITGSNTFFGSGTVNFSFTANTGQARTGTITAGGQTFTINQASGITNTHTAFDFDGDGKADVSVYRPSDGVWYLLNSSSGFTGAQFGISTDKIVPADYDGDGKTDFAVTRVVNKSLIWYLQRSSQGFLGGIEYGQADDIPVPADYDGDGKADVAVFRPSNGGWYILGSSVGFYAIQFGQVGDIPVPADYDGDGKVDIAVYRPSQGTWYIQRSQLGFTAFQFGAATDKPVPADYDGDGKADIAVYRPSNGTWYLQQSTAGFAGVQFGISTDKPVPADYDGDGKADIAVFRDGTWYIQRSTAGFTGVGFGNPTDKPVPNAFIP